MITSCSQLGGCRAKIDSMLGVFWLPTVILVAYVLVTVVTMQRGPRLGSAVARYLLPRSD